MNSSVFKKSAAVSSVLSLGVFRAALAAQDFGNTKLQNLGTSIYGDQTTAQKQGDLPTLIGGVLKAAIALLGIIFVVLIVYAGFLWMTARGQEEQVTKAKDTIQRSVIGLLIVIAAYAITSFIFARLVPAANPGP